MAGVLKPGPKYSTAPAAVSDRPSESAPAPGWCPSRGGSDCVGRRPRRDQHRATISPYSEGSVVLLVSANGLPDSRSKSRVDLSPVREDSADSRPGFSVQVLPPLGYASGDPPQSTSVSLSRRPRRSSSARRSNCRPPRRRQWLIHLEEVSQAGAIASANRCLWKAWPPKAHTVSDSGDGQVGGRQPQEDQMTLVAVSKQPANARGERTACERRLESEAPPPRMLGYLASSS
jgi:hypothetical protein